MLVSFVKKNFDEPTANAIILCESISISPSVSNNPEVDDSGEKSNHSICSVKSNESSFLSSEVTNGTGSDLSILDGSGDSHKEDDSQSRQDASSGTSAAGGVGVGSSLRTDDQPTLDVDLNFLRQHMFNGKFVYLMNHNPNKSNLRTAIVDGNCFSTAGFDLESETWVTSPDSLAKKVSTPLCNFTDSFDTFVEQICDRLFRIFPYELPPSIADRVVGKFAGNLTDLNKLYLQYRNNPNFKKHKKHADIVVSQILYNFPIFSHIILIFSFQELLWGKIKNKFHARYQKIKICGWWPPKL